MISSFGRTAVVGSLSGRVAGFRVWRPPHARASGMLAAHRAPVVDDRCYFRARKQHAVRSLSTRILASASTTEEISVERAQELLDSGDFTYLDVRTPEEYKAGHANGAVNVPVMLKSGIAMASNPSFAQDVAKAFPDKGARLVIGCKCGIRSKKACEILVAENYTNLKDFHPGYDGWVEKGLPVE